MKKHLLLLSVLALAVCMGLSSCGNDKTDNGGDPYNPENSKVAGTKWTLTNHDYDAGDDWVSTHDETYKIYFYSQTEGVFYYKSKYTASDTGTSRSEYVLHFTYNVRGGKVELDYINNPTSFSNMLEFSGDRISYVGMVFSKETIDSSDKIWLNTLRGATGSCRWYDDLKGGLYVNGKGDMADYSSFSDTPWSRNKWEPNYVEVADGVTSVGACAFANWSINEVNLPSSLKRIGAYAFAGSDISNVYMPDGITVIGDDAFADCKYLTKVYMPSKVEEIGAFAFNGCKSASLLHTKNLRRVGNGAFSGCEITQWTDSEVLEEIGNFAFTGCKFKKLVLPNSLVTIGHAAFGGSISEIHIGTGLAEVSGTPFYTTSTGSMYVNKNAPLELTADIVNELYVGNWTLYVPSGSKSVYSKAPYWKNFKSIVEESSLKGDGTETEGGNEGEEGENGDTTNQEEYDRMLAADPRRGPVASSFSGGTGTSSDPYLISSAAELRYLSDAVRGGDVFKNKYFKLTSDITINRKVLDSNGELCGNGEDLEQWIPIGRIFPSYFFCGIFDGDGHTVSGLYTKSSTSGLFGRLLGTVMNVTVRDSYISGKGDVGGIAGSVSRSHHSSTIPSSLSQYYSSSSIRQSITNCRSYATVKATDGSAGGILGSGHSSGSGSATKSDVLYVSECANFGNISSPIGVGGIIGSAVDKVKIKDCYNRGDIASAPILNVSSEIIFGRAGGIAGMLYDGIEIRNCINKGDVNFAGRDVGGICGLQFAGSSYINNCLNIADVSAEQDYGGLVGFMRSPCSTKNNYFLFIRDLPAIGGVSDSEVIRSYNVSMTEAELKSADFLTKLNKGVPSGCSKWKTGKDGYPILEWVEE